MVDVLLLQPRYEWFEKARVYPTGPPLGLGYIGAVLGGKGFTLAALDFNIDAMSLNEEAASILSINPKVVCISVNTPSLPAVYTLVRRLRGLGFEGDFLFGGPHINARPETLVALDGRYAIKGEGEVGVEGICSFLLSKKGGVDEVPNLVINDDGVLHFNEHRVIKDLDSLPLPKRSLFEGNRYKFMHITCSRGCPFKCTYCSMAESGYRKREPQHIVDELEYVAREYQNASIAFSDDVLTLDREMVLGVCAEVINRGLKAKWSCTTRSDLVDEELIGCMQKAGCWHMSFGVESGVEGIRYSLGKEITNKQYVKAFQLCKKMGVKTRAYAMFGHPKETAKEMRETIRFIKEINADEVFFSLTSIYPNTRLAAQAVKEGRISDCVWEENMRRGLGAPIYVPDNLTLEDMKGVLYDALMQFYLKPHTIMKNFLRARSVDELKQALSLFNGFISNTLSI